MEVSQANANSQLSVSMDASSPRALIRNPSFAVATTTPQVQDGKYYEVPMLALRTVTAQQHQPSSNVCGEDLFSSLLVLRELTFCSEADLLQPLHPDAFNDLFKHSIQAKCSKLDVQKQKMYLLFHNSSRTHNLDTRQTNWKNKFI
mmetsp:Transcript_1572/g.2228  ORF Transcript_1572/g.2228 Transcript_1572/m.2228 type:complete len:146 (+) Transcript_1572:74-511(+)